MAGLVDFVSVSNEGFETSPVVDALAGLRANEARYFKTKYGIDFVTKIMVYAIFALSLELLVGGTGQNAQVLSGASPVNEP